MSDLAFPPQPAPLLPLTESDQLYPVGRIFCVGRNYAAHAAEMGNEVDREAPFYFTKSPRAAVASGTTLPYPPGTADLHHEIELVVALGAPAFRIPSDRALEAVYGYGTGLDMTRRDLQAVAKEGRRPWDTGKDFEGSAVLSPLTPLQGKGPGDREILLTVNGETRQEARLSEMIWTVAELIAHLSTLYRLGPGDLIMTGTPAGVGAVTVGDRIEGQVEGFDPVALQIGAAETA